MRVDYADLIRDVSTVLRLTGRLPDCRPKTQIATCTQADLAINDTVYTTTRTIDAITSNAFDYITRISK